MIRMREETRKNDDAHICWKQIRMKESNYERMRIMIQKCAVYLENRENS